MYRRFDLLHLPAIVFIIITELWVFIALLDQSTFGIAAIIFIYNALAGAWVMSIIKRLRIKNERLQQDIESLLPNEPEDLTPENFQPLEKENPNQSAE